MSIEVRNVSFAYSRGKTVLDDISFQIPDGEFVCLLGPNGVGKSTLFKCILQLLGGYHGEILVNGTDTKSLSARQLSREIAYIPQSSAAIFNYTVKDMILMGTTAMVNGLRSPGKKEEAFVDQALELLHLNDLKDREKRKQKGKCFFGISNNFGPYHTEGYKEFWRKQFQTWNDVCFRDKYSYDLFSDIASVRYAPDALFAYTGISENEQESDRPMRLGISVINLRWELRQIDPVICDAYEVFLSRLVEEGLQNGLEIVLLSFCELQQDSAAMLRIVDRCKEKDPEAAERIRMELYYDQIDPMMQTIAQCDYILATRFHAMVLGYVLGKKVLPLCYSDKMTNVLEDLKLADHYLDIRKYDEYPEGPVLPLFAEADPEKIEKIRVDAADQFLKLDQYLK